MNSESEESYSDDISTKEEKMELDTDEDLLNDDQTEEMSNSKEVTKQKKGFDPRYAVPTMEEKQMMRNADMEIEISMLELEIKGYIDDINTDHACSEKVTVFLKTMNDFLSKLPEVDISSATTNTESIYQRVIESNKSETKLRFIKPEAVYIIGSFIQKNRSPFPITIDMTLQIPDNCISERDTLNWRYFNKRALYLAHIAEELSKQYSKLSLKYEWFQGDFDKPVLDSFTVPKDVCSCGTVLRLLPVPSMAVFSPAKLAMNRNNVHITTGPSADLLPTWFYNSSILEDMLMNHYTQFILEQARVATNTLCAGNLCRRWLHAADMDSHFNGFLCSLIIAILVQRGRITATMSVWQIFLVFLEFVHKWNVTSPLLFNSTSSSIAYTPCGDALLMIDESYGYNVSFRMDVMNMMEICSMAGSQLLRIRGVYDSMLLRDLFVRCIPLSVRYDVILKLRVVDLNSDKMYEKDEFMNLPPYLNVRKDVNYWTRRGLDKRAITVRSMFSGNSTWSVTSKCAMPEYLLLLVNLSPDNMSRLADKGPDAKSPDADAWREMWGNKSELRRYKDGSITYTNLWSCKIGENYTIPIQIVRHLLSLHVMAINEFKILSEPVAEYIPKHTSSTLSTITTDIIKKIMDTVNANDHNNGIDFGAHITSIDPIVSDVSGVSLFPIVPSSYLNASDAKKVEIEHVTIRPVQLVVMMQGATGLPSDLMMLQEVKTVWYTTMSSVLETAGLEVHVSRQNLDIFYEGYVFNLKAYTDRELALTRSLLNTNHITTQQYMDTFIPFSYLPQHLSVIKNAVLQNPSFQPALRLFKLWCSSHLFSGSVPESLIETLMLAVYDQPHTKVPLAPVEGFLRVLWLLAEFDWKSNVLVVNAHDKLTSAAVAEALTAVEQMKTQSQLRRACYVITPYDLSSHITSVQPAVMIWGRMVATASLSLKIAVEKSMSMSDVKACFKPAVQDFDVSIMLRDEYLLPIPVWMKKVGVKTKTRGVSYICTEFKNVMMNRSRFLIGYEPEKAVLECVKGIVGEGGVVMMNCDFGKQILIAWKPSFFLPNQMSMGYVEGCCPMIKKGDGKTKEDVMLVRSIFDIMRSIKEKLGDLIFEIKMM